MMLYGGRMRSSMGFFSVIIAVGVILVGRGCVEGAQSRILMARSIGDGAEADAAVELNMNNFNSTLWAAPATWAIVEFSAHWCPACRNYKPQYEKVARLFNGRNAVHAGVVFMSKVDCALKINTKLCDRFSVVHYPFLLWGKPSKFVYGSWEPNGDTGIESIENARTAELLLKWINKKIGKSYNLDDEKFEIELPANASDPVEAINSTSRASVRRVLPAEARPRFRPPHNAETHVQSHNWAHALLLFLKKLPLSFLVMEE